MAKVDNKPKLAWIYTNERWIATNEATVAAGKYRCPKCRESLDAYIWNRDQGCDQSDSKLWKSIHKCGAQLGLAWKR